jgi:8-oxo-dGTP pyrophosphatase MutT (NUDIX family)
LCYFNLHGFHKNEILKFKQMYEVFLNDRRIILADTLEPAYLNSGLTGKNVQDLETLALLTGQFLENNDLLLVLTGEMTWLWPAFQSLFFLLPAAGGVVKSEEGFLFIFRKGHWDLPKGKIDKGETPEEAALREVREETGLVTLSITGILPSTWHIYRSPWEKHQNKWILKETKWFAMTAGANQPLVPETEEDIEKAEWIKSSEFNRIQDNTYASLKILIGLLPGFTFS